MPAASRQRDDDTTTATAEWDWGRELRVVAIPILIFAIIIIFDIVMNNLQWGLHR